MKKSNSLLGTGKCIEHLVIDNYFKNDSDGKCWVEVAKHIQNYVKEDALHRIYDLNTIKNNPFLDWRVISDADNIYLEKGENDYHAFMDQKQMEYYKS